MNKQMVLPILGILLLAHAPSTAHGQQSPPFLPYAGHAVELVLDLELVVESQRVRIPLDVVQRLEVQRERERATGKYALRGLLIGAGVGGAFGLVVGNMGERMHGCGCTLSSGAIFAGLGGVIGLLRGIGFSLSF